MLGIEHRQAGREACALPLCYAIFVRLKLCSMSEKIANLCFLCTQAVRNILDPFDKVKIWNDPQSNFPTATLLCKAELQTEQKNNELEGDGGRIDFDSRHLFSSNSGKLRRPFHDLAPSINTPHSERKNWTILCSENSIFYLTTFRSIQRLM